MTSEATRPEPRPLNGRKRAITTAGVLLALLLASVDSAIVSTALPRIVEDLGGAALYAWPGGAFMGAAAVMLPIGGKLGDIFGRKLFMLVGLTGFVASSALCGIAGSMVALVVFRAVQGVFGGMLLVTMFTVIADIHQGESRARAQGLASAVFGIGSVVGPPIGGFITDALGWRWIFYVNIPFGLLALAALVAVPHVSSDADWRSIDFPGVLTLIGGIVPLLCGLSVLNSASGVSPTVLLLFAVGLVSLGCFVFVELRVADNPVVPLGIFRVNQVTVLVVVGFLSNFGMLAGSYYAPLLYQGMLGTSASQAGNWLIPMMLALIVGSTLSGRIFPRIPRYRFFLTGVLVVLMVALWSLSRVGPDTAAWLPMIALACCGAALGAIFPVLTTVVQSSVVPERLGVATSQISFWRALGGPVALAVLGVFVGSGIGTSGEPATVSTAMSGVFLTASGVVAVAAVASLLLREVPLGGSEKAAREEAAGAEAAGADSGRD
ncbi:EmrB/QacA subfamily drug resistance transporter [Actinopolyspora lacussalsi]|nr:EmrB/QacA subfamily drug resistance transporter [Actinopolyspora lacussalsi]